MPEIINALDVVDDLNEEVDDRLDELLPLILNVDRLEDDDDGGWTEEELGEVADEALELEAVVMKDEEGEEDDLVEDADVALLLVVTELDEVFVDWALLEAVELIMEADILIVELDVEGLILDDKTEFVPTWAVEMDGEDEDATEVSVILTRLEARNSQRAH